MRFTTSQFLVLVLLATIAKPVWADHSVVLVVANGSSIEKLSTLDIRKAYLGISVTINGEQIRPLRWEDHGKLDQIFLQSVMAMSEKSYERRLLSLALKFGTPRPREFEALEELVRALEASPLAVGYMWKEQAESNPRVRIVRVLWQES